jgi:hypothetical protein
MLAARTAVAVASMMRLTWRSQTFGLAQTWFFTDHCPSIVTGRTFP